MVKFTWWRSAAGWLAAAGAAVGLTLLAPSEKSLMGQLPPLAAKSRDQRLLALPQELPADRTLAVLVFRHDQKAEARSWIEGLRLRHDASIPWLKMRVLPPEAMAQAALPPGALHADRSLSVSTDAGELAQSMVLADTEHAQVVVLGRDGQVLAKAQGHFDEAKARALLETLRSQ